MKSKVFFIEAIQPEGLNKKLLYHFCLDKPALLYPLGATAPLAIASERRQPGHRSILT